MVKPNCRARLPPKVAHNATGIVEPIRITLTAFGATTTSQSDRPQPTINFYRVIQNTVRILLFNMLNIYRILL